MISLRLAHLYPSSLRFDHVHDIPDLGYLFDPTLRQECHHIPIQSHIIRHTAQSVGNSDDGVAFLGKLLVYDITHGGLGLWIDGRRGFIEQQDGFDMAAVQCSV